MNENRYSALLPYGFLVLGILFLSISPLFVRWANAPGVVTSFYRMVTVTTVTGLLFTIRRKPVTREKIPAVLFLLPIFGGLFSALDHALWSTAIENTFVANATLLNYIAPLWVSMVAIFYLHEKYSGIIWLGLGLVLAGAWIVTGAKLRDFSNLSLMGEGFAIISSFFYAGYFILSKKALDHFKVLDYLLISSGAAMAGLFLIIFINGFSLIDYTKETFLIFLIAGLFSQLGGYFSINYALSHIPAPIVSSMLIFQPVMTALLAVRFQAEYLSFYQILGGILVLGGVYTVKSAKILAI